MKVFLGTDHRGYKLKEFLRGWLGGWAPHQSGQGLQVVDCGAKELDKDDDYTDFAIKVAKSVAKSYKLKAKSLGIVVCGSGVGVCVVANKVKGIRCGLGMSAKQVRNARQHDDINVLALASDFVDVETAKEIVEAFLKTRFDGDERHVRRLRKIDELESIV